MGTRDTKTSAGRASNFIYRQLTAVSQLTTRKTSSENCQTTDFASSRIAEQGLSGCLNIRKRGVSPCGGRLLPRDHAEICATKVVRTAGSHVFPRHASTNAELCNTDARSSAFLGACAASQRLRRKYELRLAAGGGSTSLEWHVPTFEGAALNRPKKANQTRGVGPPVMLVQTGWFLALGSSWLHSMNPVLTARNLSKEFASAQRGDAPIPVLHDVDFTLDRGEMVALVGPSGSGKSTLMHCLSGLEPATRGSVQINERDLSSLAANDMARLRRDDVGFVFQALNLVPALTAVENVQLPLRLGKVRDSRSRALSALAGVGMADFASRLPARLSGGQQQRVAIARALVINPSIVFADEPTGSLDINASADVLRLLRSAASGQRSVVMSTHNVDAAALADRVLVMADGRIAHSLPGGDPNVITHAISQTRRNDI